MRGRLHKGRLLVDDFCIAGLAPQPALPAGVGATSANPAGDGDKFVLIASDLQLGKADGLPLPIQLLTDFVRGYTGGAAEHGFCQRIVRVVLAGNTACAADDVSSSAHPAPYTYHYVMFSV